MIVLIVLGALVVILVGAWEAGHLRQDYGLRGWRLLRAATFRVVMLAIAIGAIIFLVDLLRYGHLSL